MMTKKILIVDDESDVIGFLTYNFRKNGYEVAGAANGIDGIAKTKVFSPDVIITDIMMPVMNGIVMCKALKDHDKYKNIPVIFLSATQDDYQVLYASVIGAAHYISKPARFTMLLSMVEEVLSTSKLVH
jgi:two-component system alkaline phosphatase synthesis response regulator PhoP